MDMLKFVLRKRLTSTDKTETVTSFSVMLTDTYSDMTITDKYEKMDACVIEKWHDFRNTFKNFKNDDFVDGYVANLCAPTDKPDSDREFIKNAIEFKNSAKAVDVGGERNEYIGYDYYACFYSIADSELREFVKDNKAIKYDEELVRKFYDRINESIHNSVRSAVDGDLSKKDEFGGCAVYLSLGSSEAVAIFYIKKDSDKKDGELIDNVKKDCDGKKRKLIDIIREEVCRNGVFFERRILFGRYGKIPDDMEIECIERTAGDDDGTPDFKTAVGHFNDAYELLAKGRHKAHRRVQNAMNDIRHMYYQISRSEHSLDIKETLGKFLVSFLNAVTKFINNINDCNEQGIAPKTMRFNNGNAVNIDQYSSFIEGAICRVRDALSPLWHSEHAYYDDQRIIRHSVGGLLKLLYAYNSILLQWDKIYFGKEDNKGSITYFATSGGVDIVNNLDLFNYNHDVLTDNGKDESRDRPIIVFMPEASLCDISGSLFRIAHEFFHVRGYKCRTERAEHYFNGICYIFAEYCYEMFIEEVLRIRAKNIFDNEILGTELSECYADCTKSEAFERFTSDLKTDSSVIIVKHDKRLKQTLAQARQSLEDMATELTQKIDPAVCKKFVDGIVEYIKDSSSDLSDGFDDKYLIELRTAAWIRLCRVCEKITKDIENQKSDNIIDRLFDNCNELFGAILKALNSLSENNKKLFSLYDIAFSDHSAKLRSGVIFKHAAYKFIYGEDFAESHARYLIVNAMPGLYKECVADCLAIRSSGINSQDNPNSFIRYILCMLYEKRSITEFFLVSPDNYDLFMILRLCAVKDVCNLKYDEGAAVDYIVDFYKNVMFPGCNRGVAEDEQAAQKYADELKDTIDFILRKYQEYKNEQYMIELREYLNECLNENKTCCDEINRSIGYVVDNLEDEKNGEAYINFTFAKWLRYYYE